MSPSKLRGNAALKLTSHLVTARQEGGVLKVQSGPGWPQTWRRITKGEVPSTDATARSLQNRSVELQQLRVSISRDNPHMQQVDEIHQLGHNECTQLLQDAGLTPRGAAPRTGLALKADLHLPWFKLRKLRRWLSLFGVQLESKKKHKICSTWHFFLQAEPSTKYVSAGIPIHFVTSHPDGDDSHHIPVHWPWLHASWTCTCTTSIALWHSVLLCCSSLTYYYKILRSTEILACRHAAVYTAQLTCISSYSFLMFDFAFVPPGCGGKFLVCHFCCQFHVANVG